MIRKMKIGYKWQGRKSLPEIRMSGEYLRDCGFSVGDQVRVELFRDEIRIKRMTAEMILRDMAATNPSMARYVDEMDCETCE